jgi:hypothetical protein
MASRLHVLSPKRSKRLQLVGWVEPFAKPITLPIAMPPRRWVSLRSTHPTRSQTSCDGGTLRRDPIVKKLQSLRGALATKQSISPQVQVLNISVPFFVRIGQARASRWMGHCQGPPANEFSLKGLAPAGWPIRSRLIDGKQKPATGVPARASDGCDGDHVPVICPTCQIISRPFSRPSNRPMRPPPTRQARLGLMFRGCQ